MLNDLQLNSMLEDFDIAYWKINILTNEITWSEHFEALVGKPSSSDSIFTCFLNNILHKDYKYNFRAAFESLTSSSENQTGNKIKTPK